MTDIVPAKFSQSRNDMYWTLFTVEDGTIRWTGYDDNYWWENISVSETFTAKKGANTGTLYKLDPKTSTIEISVSAALEGKNEP